MESTNSLDFAQAALDELRAAVASAISIQEDTQKQYEDAQSEVEKWKTKYQFALKAKSPTLINQTKFQYDRFIAKTKTLKNLLDEHQAHVQELKKNLSDWEKRVQQLNLARVSQDSVASSKVELSRNTRPKTSSKAKLVSRKPIILSKNTESDDKSLIAKEPIRGVDSQSSSQVKAKVELSGQFASPEQSSQIKAALEQAIKNTVHLMTNSLACKVSLQEQYIQAKTENLLIYKQVEQALREENDDLATEILLKKKIQSSIASCLEKQIEQQSLQIDLLQENLTTLENAAAILQIESELVKEQASSSELTHTAIAPINSELEELQNQLDAL